MRFEPSCRQEETLSELIQDVIGGRTEDRVVREYERCLPSVILIVSVDDLGLATTSPSDPG